MLTVADLARCQVLISAFSCTSASEIPWKCHRVCGGRFESDVRYIVFGDLPVEISVFVFHQKIRSDFYNVVNSCKSYM